MNNKKTQNYNYAREALPIIFHTQTTGFQSYFEKDREKFLEFWWDHVGKRLDDSKLTPFTGIHCEMREVPEKKSKIYLFKLPHPTEFGDIHMLAFVLLPKKRIPMVNFPNTKVIALEHVELSRSSTGTMMAEVTPRGRFVPVGEGPKPVLEGFYQAVLNYLWKPKGNK